MNEKKSTTVKQKPAHVIRCGDIKGHMFWAKLYPLHAQRSSFELHRSRVSKLSIRRLSDEEEVVNFDRRWERPPQPGTERQVLDLLVARLAGLIYTGQERLSYLRYGRLMNVPGLLVCRIVDVLFQHDPQACRKSTDNARAGIWSPSIAWRSDFPSAPAQRLAVPANGFELWVDIRAHLMHLRCESRMRVNGIRVTGKSTKKPGISDVYANTPAYADTKTK